MSKLISFQDIQFNLQKFWSMHNCTILQPYDLEMGAGSFHPATVFNALSDKNVRIAFIQPSRRPTDSRKDFHPNRLERYYQFQVILKPAPVNIQDLYIESLEMLGLSIKENDILFSEDDWESPSLGASGLGWEVLCNGSEISQFTYMQQIGSIAIKPVMGEITYGLERLALQVQDKEYIQDIIWNFQGKTPVSYAEVHQFTQNQFTRFNMDFADTKFLEQEFSNIEHVVLQLVENQLPVPAYDYAIKASHIFNLLDARAAVGITERALYIAKIRNLVKICCKKWLEINSSNQINI
ncbi:MAG: glycine--tRNA ligase subunit alpha [Rickettsia sp.]|nr:glycine--tRNA ligase subunit alpha [Rickettsia sp.]